VLEKVFETEKASTDVLIPEDSIIKDALDKVLFYGVIIWFTFIGEFSFD